MSITGIARSGILYILEPIACHPCWDPHFLVDHRLSLESNEIKHRCSTSRAYSGFQDRQQRYLFYRISQMSEWSTFRVSELFKSDRAVGWPLSPTSPIEFPANLLHPMDDVRDVRSRLLVWQLTRPQRDVDTRGSFEDILGLLDCSPVYRTGPSSDDRHGKGKGCRCGSQVPCA